MGKKRHPTAKRLMITADGGGSNGYRVRLWKVELQKLADALKLPITVCHLPPGTSKWNKIEHRLFSFITINWRGKPLRSYRTIVQLIAATTTDAGLKVRAELDEKKYPKGVKVSDLQMAAVNLTRHSFHGDWNYTISPHRKNHRPKRIDRVIYGRALTRRAGTAMRQRSSLAFLWSEVLQSVAVIGRQRQQIGQNCQVFGIACGLRQQSLELR
jgi:Rhodopirellula transposase DDE domain